MGYSVRLRVLTRKSILGFGYSDVRDLSVQQLLDLKKYKVLISSYYGLDKIDFQDDILNELLITEEFRLVKPSKVDRSVLNSTVSESLKRLYDSMDDKHRMGASSHAKKMSRIKSLKTDRVNNTRFSKDNLMNKNHGH